MAKLLKKQDGATPSSQPAPAALMYAAPRRFLRHRATGFVCNPNEYLDQLTGTEYDDFMSATPPPQYIEDLAAYRASQSAFLQSVDIVNRIKDDESIED